MVNLVVPCVNIAFLTILVFYLPSKYSSEIKKQDIHSFSLIFPGDCGEKLTLSISIFVALQVFYLLLVDLIPPTSLKLSLLGTYLLFTLVLVNVSILLTIITLNVHWRHPNTHHMPNWVKRWFFEIIPPFIFMSKPYIADAILRAKQDGDDDDDNNEESSSSPMNNHLNRLNTYLKTVSIKKYPPAIQQAIRDIRYISETQREVQRDDLVCLFHERCERER